MRIYVCLKEPTFSDDSDCCLIYSPAQLLPYVSDEENERFIKKLVKEDKIHFTATDWGGRDRWCRTKKLKGLELTEKAVFLEEPLIDKGKDMHKGIEVTYENRWSVIFEAETTKTAKTAITGLTAVLTDAVERGVVIDTEIIAKILESIETAAYTDTEIKTEIKTPKEPEIPEGLPKELPEAYKKIMKDGGVVTCSSVEEFKKMFELLKKCEEAGISTEGIAVVRATSPEEVFDREEFDKFADTKVYSPFEDM